MSQKLCAHYTLGARYLYFKRNVEKFGVRVIGRKIRYFGLRTLQSRAHMTSELEQPQELTFSYAISLEVIRNQSQNSTSLQPFNSNRVVITILLFCIYIYPVWNCHKFLFTNKALKYTQWRWKFLCNESLECLGWYQNLTFFWCCIMNWIYTGCPRRNGQNFGRVFLMLNYTDITQNTYIQSWMVMEIMAIEKCRLLRCPRTVRRLWRHTRTLRMPGNQTPLANVAMQWPWRDYASATACVKCLVTLRTTMTWVWVFL